MGKINASWKKDGYVLRLARKEYADDILMAILEEEWKQIKENEIYKNKDSFLPDKTQKN